MNREVTERDFRCPEFIDADPTDYEFRGDGAIVRKDRWEQGIRNIVSILNMSRDAFEIDDVVEAVRNMKRCLIACEDKLQEGPEREAQPESDKVCQEADGCPTELAVLQRFWRSLAGTTQIAKDSNDGRENGTV